MQSPDEHPPPILQDREYDDPYFSFGFQVGFRVQRVQGVETLNPKTLTLNPEKGSGKPGVYIDAPGAAPGKAAGPLRACPGTGDLLGALTFGGSGGSGGVLGGFP